MGVPCCNNTDCQAVDVFADIVVNGTVDVAASP